MSVATLHLPGPKEVRDLLTGLLGRDVQLSTTSPYAPAGSKPTSVATQRPYSRRNCAAISSRVTVIRGRAG